MGNDDFEGKIDTKGEIELYRSFWTRLKEVVSAPEVSRRLVEAVGKKRKLDWYDIRDYDLGVEREDELITDFPRDGDIVLILECENQTEGETFIKFNSRNSDAFDLVKYRKLRHNFSNLYLTNVASPSHTLYLLLGRGDWEIERHHPEEEIMAINADTVDTLHASASAEANKLIALGSDAKFPDGVVRNIQGGLDADKSASPVRSDMYIAWDTGRVYACFTAGAWTDITFDLFRSPTELTISGGAITVSQNFHTVDTEGDTASDDLDTINGGAVGRIVMLRVANDARTVVVKHNTGNIWLKEKSDLSLDDLEDGLALIYDGSKWIDIGTGAAGYNSELKNLVTAEIQQVANIGSTTISAAQWGYVGSMDHGRAVFLTTALTSTSWDGDKYSTSEADIDLSAFGTGCPAGIKAVLIHAEVSDSDSANNPCTFRLGVGGVALAANTRVMNIDLFGEVNSRIRAQTTWVPCSAGGDIRYSVEATGANTMTVRLTIWGYVLGE